MSGAEEVFGDIITLYPERKEWWEEFKRRWGKRAWRAVCGNCEYCVCDDVEGCWCTYWNVRLGWLTDRLCPVWEPRGERK